MEYKQKYPYEYHLQYWGEVENENWIEKDLGIKERDFWFSNKLDREIFKLNLEACANRHDVTIVFDENEGSHTDSLVAVANAAIKQYILDNEKIEQWDMTKEYKKGDEVVHGNAHYVAKCISIGDPPCKDRRSCWEVKGE